MTHRTHYKRIISVVVIIIGIVITLRLAYVFLTPYRIQVDDTSMEPTIHLGQKVRAYRYTNTVKPQYGDIVEFNNPQEQSQMLVARVAGLPGDRVTITSGKLLVYNKTHPSGFDADPYATLGANSPAVDTTLAPDTYYLLGDNSPHAKDSRAVGPVPLGNIVEQLRP